MNRRRFSFWFLASLGACAALYLAAAIVVDPRGHFGLHAFPVATWDWRSMKMKLFESYNRANSVEGLLLGSSRVMEISPPELKAELDQSFFNFGVDYARAEDYLAIYRWARGRGARLKTVLIGLDVEALHSNDQFNRQLLDNDVLMRMLGPGQAPSDSGNSSAPQNPIVEMLSHGYAKDIARSAWAAMKSFRPSYSLDQDGFLRYLQTERQIAAGTFRLQAEIDEARAKSEERFKGMDSLSERRKGYLELLLAEAKQDRVRVVLWITPVHPDLIRSLNSDTAYPRLLEETQAYVSELGERYGIATYDFSEISLFGGTESGWYDGTHVDPSNASRITRRIVAGLKERGS